MQIKLSYVLSITLMAIMVCSSCSAPTTTNIPVSPTSTITPSPTPTSTSTITPSPTPTVTPTIAYPVGLNTPFPSPNELLSSQNISKIEKLAVFGKYQEIQSAIFSPSGEYLIVSINQPQEITYFYDTENYQIVETVEKSFANAQYSKDGNYIALYGNSGIEILELSSLKKVASSNQIKLDDQNAFSFIDDDSKIIAVGKNTIYSWEWKSNTLQQQDINEQFEYAAVSHGGEYLGLFYRDIIMIYSITDQKVYKTFSFENRSKLQLSTIKFLTDEILAVTYNERNLVWEFTKQNRPESYGDPGSVILLANGIDLYTGDDFGDISHYNLETGVIKSATVHTRVYNKSIKLSVSPDETLISTIGGDGKIKIWNLTDFSLVHSINLGFDREANFLFTDNDSIFAIKDGGDIIFLNIQTGMVIDEFSDKGLYPPARLTEDTMYNTGFNQIEAFAISPDGSKLGIGVDSEFSIWDISTKVKLFSIPSIYIDKHIAFSADGKYFAVSDFYTLWVWDLISGAEIYKKNHTDGTKQLGFLPGTNILGMNNGVSYDSIQFISIPDDIVLKQFSYRPGQFAFTEDGGQVVVYAEDSVFFMETENWTIEQKIDAEKSDYFWGEFTISPDTTLLAYIQADKLDQNRYGNFKIKLMNLNNSNIVHTIPGSSNIRFSPDGHYLAVMNSGVLTLWGISPR